MFPGIQIEDYTVKDYELTLEAGRPRMPAYMVCVLLMMRGKDGSVTKKMDVIFQRESMSLHALLQERGYKLSAPTTILENINAVSNETRDMMFERQHSYILREELDDYKKCSSTQLMRTPTVPGRRTPGS